MKRLLALLVIFLPLVAFAQPILRNSFSTNAPAKAPKLMTTTSGTLYPLMVTSNNVAADQDIQFSSGFYMSNNIGHFENWIVISGRTNQLSMNSSNLLFNGHAVLTNAPGSGITNSGVGTNNYLSKWTGTNSLGVSLLNDDGTNIAVVFGGVTNFILSTANGTFGNGQMTLGSDTFNPDAQFTLLGPIAWNVTSGPYLSPGAGSPAVDQFILGLNDGAGATKATQTISAARGLTDGLNLRLDAGAATDGSGGEVLIRGAAGAGMDHDGGNISLTAGNPTGTGTAGNIVLTAGNGGIIEAVSGLLLDTVSVSTLLQADNNQLVASIANAVGILTNDGSGGLGFSTNISQAITINNFTVTNLTVQSNLVVNQSIKLQGKELGSTHINGTNVFPVVNITNTASVTWAISGSNITATATGGDTSGTNIVSLTQTGTNAPSLDFSLVARGGVFKISLTNNCYFGLLANANNTDFKHCWLAVKQPSTGTCLVSFTNAFFAQPGGSALINDTNAGAVVYYEMVTSPFTNGVVEIWMSQKSATF